MAMEASGTLLSKILTLHLMGGVDKHGGFFRFLLLIRVSMQAF